jgi:hypothetical protein
VEKGQIIQWPKKKEQRDNDLENTTQKTKDRAARTPLKTGVKSGTPKEVVNTHQPVVCGP